MDDFNESGSLAPVGLYPGGTKYMVIQGEPGPIPPFITNESILSVLEIGGNQFTGQVPPLGKLQDLFHRKLYWKKLGDNSANNVEF
ncbi:hypothetical protein JHK85_025130 [Glycine max]|nr:hypothetical protein JHK85_025130 [Glycine max]